MMVNSTMMISSELTETRQIATLRQWLTRREALLLINIRTAKWMTNKSS
jgi:hypothetical protein